MYPGFHGGGGGVGGVSNVFIFIIITYKSLALTLCTLYEITVLCNRFKTILRGCCLANEFIISSRFRSMA